MSAFEKSLRVAVAAITVLVSVGAAVVSAQGPWVAPPEAKALKNPVKGIGNAKKTVSAYAYARLGDITSEQFRALAAIQRELDLDVRVSNRQNGRSVDQDVVEFLTQALEDLAHRLRADEFAGVRWQRACR